MSLGEGKPPPYNSKRTSLLLDYLLLKETESCPYDCDIVMQTQNILVGRGLAPAEKSMYTHFTGAASGVITSAANGSWDEIHCRGLGRIAPRSCFTTPVTYHTTELV